MDEVNQRAAPEAPCLDVIRDDVRAMHAYAVPDSTGLIKLDAMENPYSLPVELARALGERLSQVALNRYPPADPAQFKSDLGRAVGLPPGKALMLGNGSDELIHLMIQACARHDGEDRAVVLAPTPGFVMIEMFTRLDGCRFVGVPLKPDFALDTEANIRKTFAELLEAAGPAILGIGELSPGFITLDYQ